MVWLRLDIPLFSSPTRAYGHLEGDLELDTLPAANTHFPWPTSWVAAHPSYFAREQSLVAAVTPWTLGGSSHLVLMYGIVCKSAAEAAECAKFLERVACFRINKHGC